MVVQARLGHASAAQTLDTDSPVRPDSDDRTRAEVSAFFLQTLRELTKWAYDITAGHGHVGDDELACMPEHDSGHFRDLRERRKCA